MSTIYQQSLDLPSRNTSNATSERIPDRLERTMTRDYRGQDNNEVNVKNPILDKKAPVKVAVAEETAGNLGTESEQDESDGEKNSMKGHGAEHGTSGTLMIPEKFTRSGRRKAVPFPLKLMKILSMKEYNDVITWLPEGKSWIIVDTKIFSKTILPLHFKEAKYSSFTRKLHRWGFQRHLRGDDTGAFFHKHFQKARLNLCEKMTCYKPRAPKADLPSTKYMPMQTTGGHPAVTQMNLHEYSFPMGSYQHQNPSSYNSRPNYGHSDYGQMMPHPQMSRPRSLAPPSNSRTNDPRATSDGDKDTLDIAIELEVTRRLRETINCASNTSTTRQQVPSYMQQDPGMQAPYANQRELESRFVSGMVPGMNSMNSGMNARRAPTMGMGMDYMDPRMDPRLDRMSSGVGSTPGLARPGDMAPHDARVRMQNILAFQAAERSRNMGPPGRVEMQDLAAMQVERRIAAQTAENRATRMGMQDRDCAMRDMALRAQGLRQLPISTLDAAKSA